MNKFTLAVLLTAAAMSPAVAAEFRPFEGPKPIAVLIQTDPWAMVMGADTPIFALYENGDLIYLKESSGDGPKYFKKTLTANELKAARAKLLSFGDFQNIKHRYELSRVTDQPETKIFLAVDGKTLATVIYGLSIKKGIPTKTPIAESSPLPDSIKKLYAYIIGPDVTGASRWTPTYIEAMIWGYDYAPDESIHWPKEWPGLKSSHAISRGSSYSIFLPGSDHSKLSAFLSTRKEKGAVEIDGKKWAVSVRHTFPNEPIWHEAFSDAE